MCAKTFSCKGSTMCLILLSYKVHDHYPVVLAANRDEYYDRPSAPVSFWDDVPNVLAGRDLKDGGTWLGITRLGRIAAVTNYRDPSSVKERAPSRGWLVRDYLCGRESPGSYLKKLASKADQYNGFSLICGDPAHLYYFSNRGGMCELSPGLYGLSNHLLDTPWPKVQRGKTALRELLSSSKDPSPEDVLRLLSDRSKPHDRFLPDTGVGLDWERVLSSIFIGSPDYGTRSSTVMMIDRRNHIVFTERIFDRLVDARLTAKFEFKIHQHEG